MREIRQSGSEGGEVMSLPDPYQSRRQIGRNDPVSLRASIRLTDQLN
jgi:hypothetical protein